MKKILFIMLVVIVAASFALAQPTQATHATTSGTAGAVVPTVDVLGAHQNYGRGCAGCHAPHSGGFGAGGNAITGTVTDLHTGQNALFAQDMGPLFGESFDFSDISNTGSANKYIFAAPANGNYAAMTAQQYSDTRGIIMCLACHDGAVAKGAMMQNWAFEQQIGALPSSYAAGKIPTLLGADGGTASGLSTSGNYNNDHPIGESATISAVLGSYYNNATNGLVYTLSATNSISGIAAAGQYASFIADYGAPALLKGAHSYGTPVTAAGVPYVVCTTCHNQHSMNVYGVVGSANSIAGNSTGSYQTYFFVNGPYNPNTVNVPLGKAASTTQFCRQCHFGESNESVGGNLPTAF